MDKRKTEQAQQVPNQPYFPRPMHTGGVRWHIIPTNRSKEYIGLNLSVVVWKALVGQEVQLSDLENVDVLLTRSMQDIRTIDQKGKA